MTELKYRKKRIISQKLNGWKHSPYAQNERPRYLKSPSFHCHCSFVATIKNKKNERNDSSTLPW